VDECKPRHAGAAAAPAAASHRRSHQPGKAVQVDPPKSTLKAPGTGRLTLKYDKLLSSFAFNFNLRRYNQACTLLTRAAPNDGGLPRLELIPPAKIAKLLHSREAGPVAVFLGTSNGGQRVSNLRP